MRSSRLADLLALAVALPAIVVLGWGRGGLAESYQQVTSKSDAYFLPSVEQTYVASLGYRSAVADLIFGHVLVSYGLHFQEKRLYEHVGDYLDVITRLDPKFRDPYRFADTLLTLQPQAAPQEFYRHARRIQERGLAELPFDQELWSTAGQFITYLATGQLTDQAEKAEYQATGTRYLMRACELIGSNENIPYHCITAANILNRQGNREAVRHFLERVMQVSDDPQIQALAIGYLKRILGEAAQEEVAARQERFRRKWRADLPFASRTEVDALSPGFDPAACAGSTLAKPECATSWAAWASATESEGRAR